MSQTITIEPVSRIEGHARISIVLDNAGQVADARLQVQEFRGFESFCVGRPFWEMPVITARICGICPVSHALAAAQAGERIFGIEVPPPARRLRSILSMAQLILSHSLSFFHLSAPDIILGLDFDPAQRNIVGLARHSPETIRKGVRLRQIGQEIVNLVGGGQLHPEHIVVGGLRESLKEEGRDAIAAVLPEAMELVQFAIGVWEEHSGNLLAGMGACGDLAGLFLGLAGDDGCLDYTTGNLRFVNSSGVAVHEAEPERYGDVIHELVDGASYMKPTECLVGGTPLYRVGPLARMRVAAFKDAPHAEQMRRVFLGQQDIALSAIGYHLARLIEMVYAVEKIGDLLNSSSICDPHVLNHGALNNLEGVGVTEAPRGTLIHHYQVDQYGLLTKVNLIVATGHNSRAMDQTITDIAKIHIQGDMLTEGLLNRVEHGIRLYDPCLSCATHLHGRFGAGVSLFTADGCVIDRATI